MNLPSTLPPENLADYFAHFAPPYAVFQDLIELGELHGLRPKTLEWMKRAKVLLTDEGVDVKQAELIKETVSAY
jgi:hypothetical protein